MELNNRKCDIQRPGSGVHNKIISKHCAVVLYCWYVAHIGFCARKEMVKAVTVRGYK